MGRFCVRRSWEGLLFRAVPNRLAGGRKRIDFYTRMRFRRFREGTLIFCASGVRPLCLVRARQSGRGLRVDEEFIDSP